MPWKYYQSSGPLYLDGAFIHKGYSGNGAGKDNPSMEGVANTGPLPRGKYRIEHPFNHPHAGPYTMRLTPIAGTYTYGRDGFMIHGDSVTHPGNASNGCLNENRSIRVQMWESGDHILEVAE